MTNAVELKAQCVRQQITLEELAKAIKINPATLHRKIKGDSEFQQGEICAIQEVLKLTDEQLLAIFFNL